MATSDGDSHDEHAVQKRVGSMPGVCSIAPTSLVHQNFSRGISEGPETRLSAESVLIFKEQLEQALPPPPPDLRMPGISGLSMPGGAEPLCRASARDLMPCRQAFGGVAVSSRPQKNVRNE